MSPSQKRTFLEGDLIDRLVRVERYASESIGKKVGFKETSVFQHLTPEEKRNYNSFLNLKKKHFVAWTFAFMIPLFILGFSGSTTTGNAIYSMTGVSSFFFIGIAFLALLIVVCVFLFIILFRRASQRRLNRHIAFTKKLIQKKK